MRITVTGATDANGAAKWASIAEVKINIHRGGKIATWKPADLPTTNEFAASDLDDHDWNEIPVPNNWEGMVPPIAQRPCSISAMRLRLLVFGKLPNRHPKNVTKPDLEVDST